MNETLRLGIEADLTDIELSSVNFTIWSTLILIIKSHVITHAHPICIHIQTQYEQNADIK